MSALAAKADPYATDVTAIVATYIPTGTSFDDAEKLLRDVRASK